MQSRGFSEYGRARMLCWHIRRRRGGGGPGRPSTGFAISVMAVGAIAVLVQACGDGAVEPAPPPAPVATTVTVSPGSATLTALGETARFTGEVRDQNGQVMAGAAVAWASSDASVASVDASGLVTAVGNGTATMTATAGSASGGATVTVTQSVDSIVVSPAAATVAPGDTLRLLAEAFDENGHAIEGAEFSWSSSNDSVATVDGSGLVRGVGDGAATIMAAAGSAVGTSEITVENPDRAALVAFYEGTNGDFYWDKDTNWLSDKPLGTWHGVTTDEDGRVVELTLPNNGVWGPIPLEFGQLQKLKRLDLGSNSVEGDLPPEIGNLPDLAELNLSENAFLGSDTSIPAALGNLGKLEWLALSGTSFEGPIPRELGNLENLVRLDLADMVWLSGSIPPEFGQLVNLRRLDVTNSIGLEGALPRELVNVPLDFFHWHRTLLCSPGDEEFRSWLRGIANHRTGVVGACDGEGGVICNSWDGWTLAALHRSTGGVYWDTDDNWLSEQPLDSWHGVAVDDDGRVVELSLSDNGLRNAFSGHVLCLRNLKRLDLSGNRLTGVLGSRIGDLPDLEYLDLSDNPLLGYTGGPFLQHGTIHPIPAALGNLGKLEWLDLSGTSFGEAIPPELGSLSSLTRLDLSDMTWLSGPIPSEFGQLSHLRHLDVSDSPRMDGALPQELINVPLDLFYWNDTRLCSPPNQEFEAWLRGIADNRGGETCGSTSATFGRHEQIRQGFR